MAHFNRPEVRVDLLRAYFEQTGMSKYELARRMGWMRPNIDRVNRALGYRPDSDSRCHKRTVPRKRMGYALALRFCRALGADPVDLDL